MVTKTENKNIMIIHYKSKEIVYINFAKKSVVRNKLEILEIIDEAKKIVSQYSPKSCLIITNLTSTGFDKEISNAFKDYAKHNTPYVKASVLIGLSGMQKVIFEIVKKVTKRNYFLTNSLEEGKEWLINQ
ncbi:MAG: hypothetical protein ABF289_05740 [Clostridiales bacterium]